MPERYESAALEAKQAFLEHIRAWMDREGVSQQSLALRTGYSASTLSPLLRSPKMVTENFIRAVSCRIDALSLEYARFRVHVDGPYIPEATDLELALMPSEERLQLMEQCYNDIGGALNTIRRALSDDEEKEPEARKRGRTKIQKS